MAATIRQTSFEGSFHEQESSGKSAEVQSAWVVSEHLKEDHMGLMVQLEHILATAVQCLRRPCTHSSHPNSPHSKALLQMCEFCISLSSPRDPHGSHQPPQAGQHQHPELLSSTPVLCHGLWSGHPPTGCSSQEAEAALLSLIQLCQELLSHNRLWLLMALLS